LVSDLHFGVNCINSYHPKWWHLGLQTVCSSGLAWCSILVGRCLGMTQRFAKQCTISFSLVRWPGQRVVKEW
jgi:hypothetical protein